MAGRKMSKEREEASFGLGLFDEEEITGTTPSEPKAEPVVEESPAESAELSKKIGKALGRTRTKTRETAKEKGQTKDQMLEKKGQLRLFGGSRRGGARPGAGRPRGNKHPWSLRVTEEEKAALKSMLTAMRGG